MRTRNPFPRPVFAPEPEGYNNVAVRGTLWKTQHPLDPKILLGRLFRQSHGNRLIVVPSGTWPQELPWVI